MRQTPWRWTWIAAAALGLLAGCTSRIDREAATAAASRASQLYAAQLSERAPRLQERDLLDALQVEVETLEPGAEEPWLRPDWLSPRAPRFVRVQGDTAPALAEVQRLCQEITLHALDPAPYPCAALDERLVAAAAQRKELDDAYKGIALPPEQVEHLASYLTGMESKKVQARDGQIPDEALVQIMFGESGHTPLAQIDVDLAKIRGLVRRHARLLARVEVDAHAVLLRYAWDMRARHAGESWEPVETRRRWVEEFSKRERDPSLRLKMSEDWPKSAPEAISQRLHKDMASLGGQELGGWAASLHPAGDQYGRLLKAHARYREIQAGGGLLPVPSAPKLKVGQRSDAAQPLRDRLAQEGFKPGAGGEDPQVFDGALASALKEFQRAHQLQETGALDKATEEALKIPAARKLAQLQLALQKWRSGPGWAQKQLFINVPDFHGEFWVKGERAHRFRVVVGNTSRKTERGESVMVNATPRFWAAVDRVIYNPYWNIPERILQQEILEGEAKALSQEEQQAWLEAKGYEVKAPNERSLWVRQPPGPGNALGQVKIIFPNEHDVYLHDTPSKNLFSRPRRAFSHGCMRVHQPLTLARVLLEHDGQFDEREIERILASRESTTRMLREKVPVHIGYITARVDDDGIAHFLDDVYRLDGDALAALEKHGYAARREAP
jgi:murein L,D-transpeptidase YcbB/YkuD